MYFDCKRGGHTDPWLNKPFLVPIIVCLSCLVSQGYTVTKELQCSSFFWVSLHYARLMQFYEFTTNLNIQSNNLSVWKPDLSSLFQIFFVLATWCSAQEHPTNSKVWQHRGLISFLLIFSSLLFLHYKQHTWSAVPTASHSGHTYAHTPMYKAATWYSSVLADTSHKKTSSRGMDDESSQCPDKCLNAHTRYKSFPWKETLCCITENIKKSTSFP